MERWLCMFRFHWSFMRDTWEDFRGTRRTERWPSTSRRLQRRSYFTSQPSCHHQPTQTITRRRSVLGYISQACESELWIWSLVQCSCCNTVKIPFPVRNECMAPIFLYFGPLSQQWMKSNILDAGPVHTRTCPLLRNVHSTKLCCVVEETHVYKQLTQCHAVMVMSYIKWQY